MTSSPATNYHPWLRARTTRERMREHSRTFAARLASEVRAWRAARWAERRRRRAQRLNEWRTWRLAMHEERA